MEHKKLKIGTAKNEERKQVLVKKSVTGYGEKEGKTI